MKRSSSILCILLLMAIGLWRAYEDSSIKIKQNTVAANTLSSMMELPPITTQEVKSQSVPLDTVKTIVYTDTIKQPINNQILQDVKPIEQKKRKTSRQKYTSHKYKVEANPSKVSVDSAAYYGKRILIAIDSLDKKVSATCDTCESR